MIKLIFKNLWARKGRNFWLLLELALVTIVSWVVIDPVVVYTYIKGVDPGYDIDRLATVSLASYAETSPKFNEAEQTPEAVTANVHRLLRMLETQPEVESATIIYNNGIECPGAYNSGVTPKDSTIPSGPMHIIYFLTETDYFKTYGIRDFYTGEVLEEGPLQQGDAIATPVIVKAVCPDENPIGKSIYAYSQYYDYMTEKNPIKGVANEVINRSLLLRTPIAFIAQTSIDDVDGCRIVLRIRDGVNVDKALDKLRPFLLKELKAGNIYAHSPAAYTTLRHNRASDENKKIIRYTALAVFFFINLCIGITATFYMQTRKRSRDGGILRSFGAPRSYIVRELIGEGWVITFAGWLVGCVLYYFYIKDEGLTSSVSWGNREFFDIMMPAWFDNFWLHFSIVSAIILVLLLIVVTIGIYVPARRIASISPIDSLRSE